MFEEVTITRDGYHREETDYSSVEREYRAFLRKQAQGIFDSPYVPTETLAFVQSALEYWESNTGRSSIGDFVACMREFFDNPI